MIKLLVSWRKSYSLVILEAEYCFKNGVTPYIQARTSQIAYKSLLTYLFYEHGQI